MERETDMEQMLKMMEMFKLMQEFNQSRDAAPDMGGDLQRFPVPSVEYPKVEYPHVSFPKVDYLKLDYDEKIQTPALSAIKAAIPHLESKYRKNMSIMVKLIEIQKLLSVYGEDTMMMQSMQEGDWRKNMLLSIRPYMTEQKQYTLDMLVKCIDISELMTKMKGLTSGGALNG